MTEEKCLKESRPRTFW